MSEFLQEKYPVLVGIGCGRRLPNGGIIHAPDLPIDTTQYLVGANLVRREMNAEKGIIVVADTDLNTEGDEDIIAFREERISKILQVFKMEEHWDIVRQSRIPRERMDSIQLDEKIPLEDQEYVREEVKDSKEALMENGRKVGWLRDEARLEGGERIFDIEISKIRSDIQFVYWVENSRKKRRFLPWAGVPLVRDEQRKPPYLVKKPELHQRLCLPTDLAQLEVEMDKFNRIIPGKRAVAKITEFCDLVDLYTTTRQNNAEAIQTRLRRSMGAFLR